jgi:hypothetical protein
MHFERAVMLIYIKLINPVTSGRKERIKLMPVQGNIFVLVLMWGAPELCSLLWETSSRLSASSPLAFFFCCFC